MIMLACFRSPVMFCTMTLDSETIGGIAHAEMLGRTNLLALVAGGTTPRFPDRNGQ